MENKELNIKSSTIEKGLDLAKDFLGKLISPTVEEVGLLLSDNIKLYRFKNQVKILLKAKKYVEDKNIKLKEIPTKILVPLLENASLEDNEDIQDKWAAMIANFANSKNNLQNQIFPYLLSQISIEEYDELKYLQQREIAFEKKYHDILKLPQNSWERNKALKDYEREKIEGHYLTLEEYEKANLVRLGLVRQLPPRMYIEEFNVEYSFESPRDRWYQPELEIDIDEYGFKLTELGEKFLLLCELELTKMPEDAKNPL